MSNYVETKKELDRIRREYGCKGDMIFRAAYEVWDSIDYISELEEEK